MKRIIQTNCKCYKPNEYVELSKTPISVFCKHCKRFITNICTEEELEYLIKFGSETDTGRGKMLAGGMMLAERNVEKFKEAKNNPVVLNNAIKEFGSEEGFDRFISNMEHILNRLKN
jgi:hypothetical protein